MQLSKGSSQLLTLADRKTLYTIIVRLSEKQAYLLAVAAVIAMKPYRSKVKAITFDNGLEFAKHETIAGDLSAKIYFAHPYASWEHGINGNTNGLIRQYFPKGMDFNEVTDHQVKQVMKQLNKRPRRS